MPSNQCTNTLMELSFAVGNMFGAADCDKSDWNQLKEIVDHWECKTTGDAGEELGNMVGFIQDALAQPNTTAGKIEMKDRCVDLFYSHNRLVNSLNLFDQDQLSLQGRGPVPFKRIMLSLLSKSLATIPESAGWLRPTPRCSP